MSAQAKLARRVEADPAMRRALLAAACGVLAIVAQLSYPVPAPAFWACAVVLATLSPAGLLAPLAAGLVPLPLTMRLALAAAGAAAWVGQRASERRVASLEREAFVDRLTGLYRYDFFVAAADFQLRRARRYGDELSLVLLDLDNFKHFNDRYGHAAGNTLLALVGEVVRTSARSADLAARFGGEELAVLVQGDARSAGLLAARVRRAVAGIEVPTDLGIARVTVSAGVAEATRLDSVTALVEAADEALYEAKRRGRNRVVLAPARRHPQAA